MKDQLTRKFCTRSFKPPAVDCSVEEPCFRSGLAGHIEDRLMKSDAAGFHLLAIKIGLARWFENPSAMEEMAGLVLLQAVYGTWSGRFLMPKLDVGVSQGEA